MTTRNFRFLTSGESHGKCLTAIIEGVPAGIRIKPEIINEDLARRQIGYGRGERMQIEKDSVEIKSGIRLGKTTGAPICLEIKNKDFSNWEEVMNPLNYEYPTEEMLRKIEERSFTRVRPGHADYAGAVKYNLKDLRDVLERSSARKTAIEVAVGSVAKQILKEFGIMGFSHVIQIGDVKLDFYPKTYTLIKEKAEKSPLRCSDDLTTDRMINAINKATQDGDTLGGKFEVIFGNLPIGLGSYVHWDTMLDGKIAQAVMSIPGVKAVEVGAGVDAAHLTGSQMHDELFVDKNKNIYRQTNNAGGIEGGMTNGETLIIKGTMKAIPTMKKTKATVDLKDMTPAVAHFERSDTCAVPACAVVAEARVAIVLVDELLSKIGGDSLVEMKAHYGI
ncbi:MAG: chorismate synthase [Cyanobacteria bacterium SIG31]|nr:chorismate synthase [Cyanobacteria bacterium SIG31]